MESTESQELNVSENTADNTNVTEMPKAQEAQETNERTNKTFKESIQEKLVTSESKPEVKQEKQKISFDEIGSIAPADMSKEEKEIFAKLDPKAQNYLARMSKHYRSDYGRQTQQIKNMESRIKPLLDIVSAEEQELAKLGVRPEDAVKEGLAWKKAFKTDPRAAAKEIFKTYGIDPIDLIDDEPAAEAQQNQGLDPNQIKEQIRNEILKEFEQKQIEAQQKQAMQSSQDVVNKFIKSKPLFTDPIIGERLEAEMAGIVRGSLESQPSQNVEAVLEKAYDYVVKSNPEFSAIMQKYNAKSEAQKLQSEAEKARYASRSISGGASSPVPNSNRGVPFKAAFSRNLGTSYD